MGSYLTPLGKQQEALKNVWVLGPSGKTRIPPQTECSFSTTPSPALSGPSSKEMPSPIIASPQAPGQTSPAFGGPGCLEQDYTWTVKPLITCRYCGNTSLPKCLPRRQEQQVHGSFRNRNPHLQKLTCGPCGGLSLPIWGPMAVWGPQFLTTPMPLFWKRRQTCRHPGWMRRCPAKGRNDESWRTIV